jgi:hypothetical protein
MTPNPVILPLPAPPMLPVAGGPLSAEVENPVTLWARSEALGWWIQGNRVPPLLSASPAGTPLDQAGILTSPGTQTVFGDSNAAGGVRSGGRYTLGIWVDDGCKAYGLEGSFFHLPGYTVSGAVGGGGSIAGRPFVVASTGAADAQLISYPGVVSGVATADVRSSVMGADALIRCPVGIDGCDGYAGPHVDVLLGYRWLQFEEDLTVRESVFPLGPPFVPGSHFYVQDSFRVRNTFHGILLGLASTWRQGDFSLELAGRLNIGHLQRHVCIDGFTTATIPGAGPAVAAGGLLTQSSNIGSYNRSVWTVIPEVDVRLGYDITSYLRVFMGYSALVLNDFYRTGNVVDPNLNTVQIQPVMGGPTQPAFAPRSGTIWLHGINLGAELRF